MLPRQSRRGSKQGEATSRTSSRSRSDSVSSTGKKPIKKRVIGKKREILPPVGRGRQINVNVDVDLAALIAEQRDDKRQLFLCEQFHLAKDDVGKQAMVLEALGDFYLNSNVPERAKLSCSCACYVAALTRFSCGLKPSKGAKTKKKSARHSGVVDVNLDRLTGKVSKMYLSKLKGIDLKVDNLFNAKYISVLEKAERKFLDGFADMQKRLHLVEHLSDGKEEAVATETTLVRDNTKTSTADSEGVDLQDAPKDVNNDEQTASEFCSQMQNLLAEFNQTAHSVIRQIVEACLSDLSLTLRRCVVTVHGSHAQRIALPQDGTRIFIITKDEPKAETMAVYKTLAELIEYRFLCIGKTPLTKTKVKLVHDVYNPSLQNLCDPVMEKQQGLHLTCGSGTETVIVASLEKFVDIIDNAVKFDKLSHVITLCHFELIVGDKTLLSAMMEKTSAKFDSKSASKPADLIWLEYILRKQCYYLKPPRLLGEGHFDAMPFEEVTGYLLQLYYISELIDALQLKFLSNADSYWDKITLISEELVHHFKLVLTLWKYYQVFIICGGMYTSEDTVLDILKFPVNFIQKSVLFMSDELQHYLAIHIERMPLKVSRRLKLLDDAYVLVVLGKPLDAVDALRAASEEISTLPLMDQVSTYTNFGLYFLHKMFFKEAIQCFTQSLEVKESTEDYIERGKIFAVSWMYLGLAYFKEKRYKKGMNMNDEAMEIYQQMIGSAKPDPEVKALTLELRAFMSLRLEKFSEATEHYETLYKQYNKSKLDYLGKEKLNFILSELSGLCLKAGNLKSSISILRRVLNNHEVHVGLQEHKTATLLHGMSKRHALLGNHSLSDVFRTAAVYNLTKLRDQFGSLESPLENKAPHFVDQLAIHHFYWSTQLHEKVAITRKHLEHVVKLVKSRDCKIRSPLEISKFMHDLAVILFKLGKYAESNKLLDSCVKFLNEKAKLYSSYQVFKCLLLKARCCFLLGQEKECSKTTDMAHLYHESAFGKNALNSYICELRGIIFQCKASMTTEQADLDHLYSSQKSLLALFYGENYAPLSALLEQWGDSKAKSNLKLAAELYEQALNVAIAANENRDETDVVIRLEIKLAVINTEKENLNKARSSYEHALSVSRKLFEFEKGRKHTDTLSLLQKLALIYRNQKDRTKAISTRHEILEFVRELPSNDSGMSVAKASAELAYDLVVAQKYDEAVRFYKLAIDTVLLLPQSRLKEVDVGLWMTKTAEAYKAMGHDVTAASYFAKSLEYSSGSGVASNEALLQTLSQLAATHEDEGDFEKALAIRIRAMERNMTLHGAAHLETARALEDLAHAHVLVEDFEEAAAVCQKTEDMLWLLRVGVVRHTRVKLLHADCLRKSGYYSHAMDLYFKVIEMFQQSQSKQSAELETNKALVGVGLCFLADGQYNAAVDKINLAITNLNTLDLKSARVSKCLADALSALGQCHESILDHESAKSPYFQALAIRDAACADGRGAAADQRALTEAMRASGRCASQLRDFKRGLALLSSAVERLRQARSKRQLHHLIQVLLELGQAQTHAQNLTAAVATLEEALRLLGQVQGHDEPHFLRAHLLQLLGSLHGQLHMPEHALRLCLHSEQIYKEITGPLQVDHPEHAGVLECIGDYYTVLKQPQNSLKFYKLASQKFLSLFVHNCYSVDVTRVMRKLETVPAKVLGAKVQAVEKGDAQLILERRISLIKEQTEVVI